MADKIQCTIEGCYQKFSSVEAMEKHKTKMKKNPDDDLHDFWCEKCHHDSVDDIQYLIHQITSPKHIVCPACGLEFKSEGGRNRHVGISHRQKQRMLCAGCGEIFDSASGYMGHIEGNKCRVIRKSDFESHRAEQEIDREVASKLNDGMLNSIISAESNDEPSLFDERRHHVELDWQGAPMSEDTTSRDSLGAGLSQAVSNLSIDYPALQASGRTSTTSQIRQSSRRHVEEDLLDEEDGPVRNVQPAPVPATSQAQSVWDRNRAARRQRPSSGNLLDDNSSVNLMSSNVSANKSTGSWNTWAAENASRVEVPPAANLENQDPNAAYQKVTTQKLFKGLDREKLQSYWNPILGVYLCPGDGCGQKLRSVEEFHRHLSSPTHAKRSVQCPTCLKRFKTTTALVAHAESGSVRCNLRHAEDYDAVMQQITAGLIRVDGAWSGAGNAKFEAIAIDDWSK